MVKHVRPHTWKGELLRWYLTQARHPFKDYIVGHYWAWFAKPRLWITYDETSVISVSLNDYLQQQIFFERYYERPLVDWLKQNLQADDVFWDVGANVGAISLVAAKLCRCVVAFEPSPEALGLLTAHVEGNGLSNITIVPCALGEDSAAAPLHLAPSSNLGMGSLVRNAAASSDSLLVQVARADEFARQHPSLLPTVIKIDVEGAEHLVVRGAHDVLRSRQLRAIVFEDQHDPNQQPTNRALVDCLHDAGYRVAPFGLSDEGVEDGMYNFLATRPA